MLKSGELLFQTNPGKKFAIPHLTGKKAVPAGMHLSLQQWQEVSTGRSQSRKARAKSETLSPK
jgi:hypothetical protein